MNSKKFDEDSTIIIFIILFQLPKVTGINERDILKVIVDNFKDYYNRISHQYIIYDILQDHVNAIEEVEPWNGPPFRAKISMDRDIDTSIHGARCLGFSRRSLWQDIFKDLTFITEKNFLLQINEENELIPASIRVRAKYLKRHKLGNLLRIDHGNFINEGKRLIVMKITGRSRRRVGLHTEWEKVFLNHGIIDFPKSRYSAIITEDGQDLRDLGWDTLQTHNELLLS